MTTGKKKRIYSFLPIILFGIISILLLINFPLGKKSQGEVISERQTKFFMGTVVEINLYGDKKELEKEKTEKIFQEVFKEIKALEDKFTRGKIIGGSPVVLDDELIYVIKKAIYFSEISGGAFDVTIGPVASLWNIHPGQENKVPLKKDLNHALSLVDYKRIKFLGENTIQMDKKGMIADFGAIAKGYAADKCRDILKRNGIDHGIINLGGNVYALGTKPTENKEDKPWSFGIQDPFMDRGDFVAIVKLEDQSLVTSGIYERYFEEDGKIYHHIFDHQTGYPIDNELLSVSIIADESLDADALSTAIFAVGLEKGMEILEEYGKAEGIFITKNNKIFLTSGLIEEKFILIKDEKYEIKEYELNR